MRDGPPGAVAGGNWPLTGDVIGDDAAAASLVVLHGFGDGPRDVLDLARELTPDGDSTFLPRMRGSELVHDDCGWAPAHHAGDLQRLCHSLGRHDVVGYSYGASIAAAYALAVGPDRVRALVLIDQAFGAQPEREVPEPWTEANDLLWDYDYSHQLLAAPRIGIPTLLIIGSGSHVVPPIEEARWVGTREEGLRVARVEGNHRELVTGRVTAAPTVRQFIETVRRRTT